MNKKQIWGIIITGIVIIAVGVSGVISNVISNKLLAEQEDTISSMFSLVPSEQIILPVEDFIAQIDIVGEIGPSTSGSLYMTHSVYNHDLYMNLIDELMYADNNKGILLYVDSPGGTVYESDELYLKLMEYKELTGRPIYAYFATQACSGGYYIAMAADYICANRNCWTGSIGVIISLMNMKDLYDKIGIQEIDITSGENKAMGAAGAELTEEQYAIMQGLVDEAYDQFVDIVCEGRNMDEKTVRQLADGRIYSAKQAYEADLIDSVGSYEDCIHHFEENEDLDPYITYYTPDSPASDFFASLFGVISDLKPQSELDLATDIMENHGNGVLKYYAK